MIDVGDGVMGHYVEVILADSIEEVGEHIDRLIDEGYADYCKVIRKFDIRKLNREKFAEWVRRNAPEEDPEELLEEALKEGKRYIYFLDCHI